MSRRLFVVPDPVAETPSSSASGGSLTDTVYQRLEAMIVTLQLPPGALLSEVELGRKLGVSRTPVSAALQRLAREGLVTILPRRGIVVTDVSVMDQLNVLELRREISRFMARTGARRANREERARMDSIAKAFLAAAESNDEDGLLRADKDFHDLFAACTHNPFVCSAMDALDSQARRFWYAHRTGSSDFALTAKLHTDIAAAIASGDEQAAEIASDALSTYLEEFARKTIEPGR
ncbi:MAG TPA: GntR family transcriptional regulator [Microvirga sp.]|nr:GntR family transcriptional regulator [Microvirga sp.]